MIGLAACAPPQKDDAGAKPEAGDKPEGKPAAKPQADKPEAKP